MKLPKNYIDPSNYVYVECGCGCGIKFYAYKSINSYGNKVYLNRTHHRSDAYERDDKPGTARYTVEKFKELELQTATLKTCVYMNKFIRENWRGLRRKGKI